MTSETVTVTTKKQRLEHVDAMRPLKQLGVVSNHVLLFFAPALSFTAGGMEMLLHVTREAFLFISACMLTYAYYDLKKGGYTRFYKRRAVSVLLPYICWTIIYWLINLRGGGYNWYSGFIHFLYLLGTGYYQLYYLVLIMEFYIFFPLFLYLVKKTKGHHGLLMILCAIAQAAYVSVMHWNILPHSLQGFWANREIMSYLFYLLAGMVIAFHFEDFHKWVVSHVRLIVAGTLVSAALAEAWYFYASHQAFAWMGASSDPFQPIVIPFNVAAIASIYLIGVYLVGSHRPKFLRSMARSGAENSYGVYTSQMLFISVLFDIGWLKLSKSIPWGIACLVGIVLVFGAAIALTSLLARTPLSLALTGRKRQTWSSLIPNFRRNSGEKVASDRAAAEEIA